MISVEKEKLHYSWYFDLDISQCENTSVPRTTSQGSWGWMAVFPKYNEPISKPRTILNIKLNTPGRFSEHTMLYIVLQRCLRH